METTNNSDTFPRDSWGFIYTSEFHWGKIGSKVESLEVDGIVLYYSQNNPSDVWVGNKIECIGQDAKNHDSETPLVSKSLPVLTTVLDRPGWWIETNGFTAQSLIENGLTPSYKYKDLLRLFPGITKFNTDGSYVRKINGHNYTEFVFGNFVLK